jgi:hypothetical protein
MPSTHTPNSLFRCIYTWLDLSFAVPYCTYTCPSLRYLTYSHDHEVSIASAVVATTLISSLTTRSLMLSFVHPVVPFRNTYRFSFCTRSFGLRNPRSISVPFAVITHASTFDPEPRSLKIPAEIAAVTNFRPSSLLRPCRQPDSKTAIAAREPDPIVT